MKCENADVGAIGAVNGKAYTVVENLQDLLDNDSEADFTCFCISKVTELNNMFSGNTNFNQDISSWDTSNVTTMERMFYGAANFNNGSNQQGINNWDTSKVTNMSWENNYCQIFIKCFS